MNPNPGRRPSWVDDRHFPFESRFVDVDGHTIHYVDEGDGPPLLLLHGNPTWAYLYRHLIPALRQSYRCIAFDYPGFGLSLAGAGYGFTPAEHAAVTTAFVDHLDLEDLIVFVQDWGGPIGLGMAGRRSDRIAGLVIANTWAWPVGDDKHFTRFSAMLGGAVGRVLIERLNLFVNVLLPRGHARTKLTKEDMAHYRGPFPTSESRLPTAVFPREIVGSGPFLAEVESGLAALTDVPALIVWGAKDFAFREKELRRFESLFPHHRTHVVADASHYIQDDAADDVVAAIRGWQR